MSIFNNNLLAGAAAQGGTTPVHTIDQSIRFNQAENASMSRTPSSASSRTTWTFSWWWKRGNLSAATIGTNQRQPIFGTTAFSILSNHNSTQIDGINVVYTGTANDVQTSEKFRDTSAWYNFQAVLDTTNDVASERFRLYKNGQRITDFASITYPAKDTEYTINNTQAHYIGFRNSGENLDGYLAEIVFIDGQALDPSSFGEYNSSGIWIPKDVSGLTFGTNGFHIDGRDSADLGDDESGNNNDYSTSGLASHDQVPDSPTNNFCVLSRINMGSALGVTLRDGNLDGRTSGTAGNGPASISLDSGKWYYELNAHAAGSGLNAGAGETPTGSFHHFTLGSNGNQINANGEDREFSSGSIVGFKLDIDGGTLEYTTDGSSYSTVQGSLTANTAYAPYMRLGASSGRGVFNFGQDSSFGGLETSGSANASDDNGVGDFYYSVPSGFLAICTKNLGS
jgi:hypothetical protein